MNNVVRIFAELGFSSCALGSNNFANRQRLRTEIIVEIEFGMHERFRDIFDYQKYFFHHLEYKEDRILTVVVTIV